MWAPDVARVGALLPARFGTEGPTDATTPSRAQIATIIEQLAPGLVSEVGTIGAEQHDQAATTLALGAAAYIENSFIPEQSDGLDGPAEFFRRRYQEQIVVLRREIRTATRVRLPAGAPRLAGLPSPPSP